MRILMAWNAVRRAILWLGGREPVVLVMFLMITGGTWLFLQIADEVSEGETRAFDERILRAFRESEDRRQPIGPPWLEEAARDVTAMGGATWLVFFTVVVAGYLWVLQKHRMAIFVIAAIASGLALSLGLKYHFARPRPDIVPPLMYVYTSSFPSGHSMLSAVVYLTLGSLLATVMPRRRLKLYVLAVGLVMSFLVGLSRVYLGVHYPTDVLGGWTAGVVWSLICWLIARWLQIHGKVEDDHGRRAVA